MLRRICGRLLRHVAWFAAFVPLLAGCTEYLGRRLVTAPNLKDPIRGVDAPASVMASLCISRQLRVLVAQDVSLWVSVSEPSFEQEMLYFEGGGRKLRARIVRRPATRP